MASVNLRQPKFVAQIWIEFNGLVESGDRLTILIYFKVMSCQLFVGCTQVDV